MFDEKLWNDSVKFHGHACPGLALGFKVCQAAGEKMNLEFSEDEEIVCIVENDACGVDAIQYITGCTFGKGNLIFRDVGKHAYSFFNRKTGESARIILKYFPHAENISREERMKNILNAETEELFDFKIPQFKLPEKARIFKSVNCEICGENTSESRMRLQDGEKVCLDCYCEYSRTI